MRAWAALGLVLAVAGCSSANAPGQADAGPCGRPCGSGEGCDVASHACAPGAKLSERCGADAPSGAPTICVEGLACGVVTDGKHVCVQPCTAAEQCPTGQTCFQVTVSGERDTYCGTPASLGQDCSPEGLRECRGAGGGQIVACIASPDAGSGTCMQLCDPSVTCPSGQVCSTPFSNGGGVCIAPTNPGDACNQDALHFCENGQVCVVESGSDGRCHVSCDPADGGCSGGQACVRADACATAGPGFCVAPQPDGGDCTPASDHFCGPDYDCVNLGASLSCVPDCTQGQACSAGSCHGLPDGCRSACF